MSMHAMRAMHSMSHGIRPCFSGNCRLVPGGGFPDRPPIPAAAGDLPRRHRAGRADRRHHARARRPRRQRDHRHGEVRVVVQIAFVIAGLALVDAGSRSSSGGIPPASARA